MTVEKTSRCIPLLLEQPMSLDLSSTAIDRTYYDRAFHTLALE